MRSANSALFRGGKRSSIADAKSNGPSGRKGPFGRVETPWFYHALRQSTSLGCLTSLILRFIADSGDSVADLTGKDRMMNELEARVDAECDRVFGRTVLTVNPDRPAIVIDNNIWKRICQMRQNGENMLARTLVAIHYAILLRGTLQGTIPARWVRDWIYGTNAQPTYWRTRLSAELAIIEEVFQTGLGKETRSIRLELIPPWTIRYHALPAFFGVLGPMIIGNRLRLVRKVELRKINWANARQFQERVLLPGDLESVKSYVHELGQRVAAKPTLASLTRDQRIKTIFPPAALGLRPDSAVLETIAHVLAPRAVACPTGCALVPGPALRPLLKVTCPALDPIRVYTAFSGLSTDKMWDTANEGAERACRRYHDPDFWTACSTCAGESGATFREWMDLFGIATHPNEFLQLLSEAADPLLLTVVGVGDRRFFSLAELLDMDTAQLELLRLRFYAPTYWPRRWARVFGLGPMRLPIPEPARPYNRTR